MRRFSLAALAGLLILGLNSLPAAADAGKPSMIISTALRLNDPGTIWRYHETWQSDVTQVGDKLINVDVFDARAKAPGAAGKSTWVVKPAKRVMGSPFPPDDWRNDEFDDSGWLRHPGPFPNFYRSLAQISMRGKFNVIDPAAAGELSLSVKFQGGAIAYLNGQEIGRSGMPAGKIDNSTLADPYPHEAFADGKNELIPTTTEYPGRIYGASEKLTISYTMNRQDMVDGYESRARSLDVKVPANLLKKGVNVLAIEIHRAVADPIMFTSRQLSGGNCTNIPFCWNRASCEMITLTATGSAAAIEPNITRPKEFQVWQEDVLSRLGPTRYADPNEPARPIKLQGLRNGVYAGQIMVGSTKAVAGLHVSASDLKQGTSIIPASAISISYPTIASDAMNPDPPATIPAGEYGVAQPIWLTVNVGRDIPAGTYTGSATVNVDGEKAVQIPIQMTVIGNWTLPDPANFTEFMGVHESADSVAMQYNLPLWSEDHWKDLDKIYELLGEIGTKDIYLPIVAKTHLANEQSMVRWIKQPDGTYKYDFSVLERYLDTALKHLGKVPVVCVYLHDYGFRVADAKMAPIVPTVTEFDPATGKLTDMRPPNWGTPEARAFWKPVIDGVRDILAKRGVEKSMMFGIGANNWVLPACCQDLKTMYPDVPWVNRTHYFSPTVGDGAIKQKVGLSSVVGGVISLFYDVDTEKHFGWKSPDLVINFPRFGNVPGAVFDQYLSSYRVFGESALLSGGAQWRSVELVRGVGHIGADFWPVLKDAKGVAKTMGDRYVFWHSLSISEVIPSILGAGTKGPVATTRFQMMRESLQEAEARVFVQNALLDKSQAGKLGPDLAKRCQELCDERTDCLRYYSQFCEPLVLDDYAKVFDQQRWEELSAKLDQAAGDVQLALARK